jgi:hypothetical protein
MDYLKSVYYQTYLYCIFNGFLSMEICGITNERRHFQSIFSLIVPIWNGSDIHENEMLYGGSLLLELFIAHNGHLDYRLRHI